MYARHITWYPSKLFDVHAKRYVVMATRMVFCDEHVTLRYVTARLQEGKGFHDRAKRAKLQILTPNE